MGDRRVVIYEEERSDDGPHWTLEIERSSSGNPDGLITIRTEAHDPAMRHIRSMNHELTIVVRDIDHILQPIIDWAIDRRKQNMIHYGSERYGF